MTQIKESTYYSFNALWKYADQLNSTDSSKPILTEDSFHNTAGQNIEMKMMDTILFDTSNGRRKELKPTRWIFTDLMSNFQYKDIESISVSDVVRAFLVNLNIGKKRFEYNNDDLMNFIQHNKLEKIAVAIVNNKRHFLDITDFSNIRSRFKEGMDALQLYKIPTKEHFKLFYWWEYCNQQGRDEIDLKFYKR